MNCVSVAGLGVFFKGTLAITLISEPTENGVFVSHNNRFLANVAHFENEKGGCS